MVVQHNLTAMNANRQLGITTGAQAKSSEKLSSGYRINRAGDDAAGLTISEKMRSQIRGLNKASSNAQDGVSLIQVAEGALNETHSILQRMNELATQAANDTNTTADRGAIQAEIDQLTSEINRISSTTQFNTMNLIDGNFTGKSLQVARLLQGRRVLYAVRVGRCTGAEFAHCEMFHALILPHPQPGLLKCVHTSFPSTSAPWNRLRHIPRPPRSACWRRARCSLSGWNLPAPASSR